MAVGPGLTCPREPPDRTRMLAPCLGRAHALAGETSGRRAADVALVASGGGAGSDRVRFLGGSDRSLLGVPRFGVSASGSLRGFGGLV